MRSPASIRSALSEFLRLEATVPPPSNAAIYLTERFLGHIDVRGDPANESFTRIVEQVTGCVLPLTPNTTAERESTTALWLGPDEWLLLTTAGSEGELAARLRQGLQGHVVSIVDITHGQVVIRLTGARAPDLLRKGCSLDLHPRVFGPGRCAQTILAKVGVTLRFVDTIPSPSFDLIVRRSFAEYLAYWIKDAGEEFGLSVSSATSSPRASYGSQESPLTEPSRRGD